MSKTMHLRELRAGVTMYVVHTYVTCDHPGSEPYRVVNDVRSYYVTRRPERIMLGMQHKWPAYKIWRLNYDSNSRGARRVDHDFAADIGVLPEGGHSVSDIYRSRTFRSGRHARAYYAMLKTLPPTAAEREHARFCADLDDSISALVDACCNKDAFTEADFNEIDSECDDA